MLARRFGIKLSLPPLPAAAEKLATLSPWTLCGAEAVVQCLGTLCCVELVCMPARAGQLLGLARGGLRWDYSQLQTEEARTRGNGLPTFMSVQD